jgi:modification methylase
MGAPACNGWTFWCASMDGRRVPIDVLRQKLRAELN